MQLEEENLSLKEKNSKLEKDVHLWMEKTYKAK